MREGIFFEFKLAVFASPPLFIIFVLYQQFMKHNTQWRHEECCLNIQNCKIEKTIMRIRCLILFFIACCFSVFSQQPANTTAIKSDSTQSKQSSSKNSESPKGRNNKAVNLKDSTAGNSKLKSKLSNVYKKLDNSPITHKYVKQLDDLKGRAVNKYKKIDSTVRSDTAGDVARVIAIGQRTAKTIKSKKEERDSINIYKLTLSAAGKKADTLPPAALPPEIKTIEKQNPQEKAAMDYVTTGTLYLSLKKTNDAIFYFEKGLHAAQETHSLGIVQRALKGLSDAYAQKSDVKKALFYFKQYAQVKDSLVKLITDKDIAELQLKYEGEKKQREIQSLILDAQEKKSVLKKTLDKIQEQKQFILLTALALFLTILLTINIFRQYRSKKKINETLQIQNNKIEAQKKELEKSLVYTQQLQEALKEDLDHYMQAALRKQMNPHFIFNSLNSIQSFILQNDKLSANIYLSKFAGLMRKVLENSQHRLISVEKEIDVLKLYIELEEQRFDNKFNCIWIIDKNIDLMQEKVPPLILQPYVENAIWHGLLHKEGERTLTISILKNENRLVFSVQDNGIGRTAAAEIGKNKPKHKSLGTKITQKRIDLINSLDNSGINMQYFDLHDNEGKACGTKAELVIPAADISLINEG